MTSSTTHKHARTLASVIAAGALLAVPAAGIAAKHGKAKGKPASAEACAKAHAVGFSVRGTLVSVTPDVAATPASEATVTMTVRSANRHARRSGELADMNATKPGVQPRGATYTVAAGDAYVLRLRGYEGMDAPSAGDRVRVGGKVALTRKRCAAATSVADRYGTVDVRKVAIADRDADA